MLQKAIIIFFISLFFNSPSFSGDVPNNWVYPDEALIIPEVSNYKNSSGTLQILNASGSVNTKDHPFFEASKPGGRACVTCHQPADGMSLSALTAQETWKRTNGKDPLFNAIDGSNCPDLPQDKPESHSLLLNKGLFRIALPWPPKNSDGSTIEPEFSIEVINDPTGCNLSSEFGLQSSEPKISVFRRPRMAANLKYVEPETPAGLWYIRNGKPRSIDPETGNMLADNMMADARFPILKVQMVDAMKTHLESGTIPNDETLNRLRNYELQIYAAQVEDITGGSLQSGGANMGPEQLRNGKPAQLNGYPKFPMFPGLEGWRTKQTFAQNDWPNGMERFEPTNDERINEKNESPEQKEFRDSVARGYDLFMYRKFLIRDVNNVNRLIGNPFQQSCAICHNMQATGLDVDSGYLDLGTTNHSTGLPAPDLPLFKLTCDTASPPHPYEGRVIYSRDPGRALISGKCEDIGQITAQQMRALAARAPFFSDGSAKTIIDVVEFYDSRFNIGLTEREKQDLANFMRVL